MMPLYLSASLALFAKGWVLLPIAATVAFIMLLWAEWDRHDEKKKAEKYRDRIAVITDRGGENRPRWYPEHTLFWNDDPGARNLALDLHALRSNRIPSSGIRCTVENPNGLVTVAILWTPPTVEPSHHRILLNYPSAFQGAEPVSEGTYCVLWEDNGPDVHRQEFSRYVFEVSP